MVNVFRVWTSDKILYALMTMENVNEVIKSDEYNWKSAMKIVPNHMINVLKFQYSAQVPIHCSVETIFFSSFLLFVCDFRFVCFASYQKIRFVVAPFKCMNWAVSTLVFVLVFVWRDNFLFDFGFILLFSFWIWKIWNTMLPLLFVMCTHKSQVSGRQLFFFAFSVIVVFFCSYRGFYCWNGT